MDLYTREQANTPINKILRAFGYKTSWEIGTEGEDYVINLLSRLGDKYTILNDLMISGGKGNIDHVVIGPNGIFVIETKNLAGRIRCNRDRWAVGYDEIDSPAFQVKSNASRLINFLNSALKDFPIKFNKYVVPVVVFVNLESELALSMPTVDVLRSYELIAFILNNHVDRQLSGYEINSVSSVLRKTFCDGPVGN